jgi:hypothetical protein
MFRNFRIIDKSDAELTQRTIDDLAEVGGGVCLILPDVSKGVAFEKIPEGVTVIDLRYGGSLSILAGNHPRKEGIWTQYSGLSTGLARNVVISDSITNDTPIENWKGEPHEMQEAPYGESLASEDYRHQHNHYQNLLSEVFNFSDSLNAIAIWGDSGAFVPGAKSWGGFFSARSWPVHWTSYTPATNKEYRDEDFDAALVGVEVDVLNSGRDWGDRSPLLSSSMAKIGVQIVGFGKRNTAAIEIRTEDSDDASKGPEERRGAWRWGLIIRNALHEQSTLLHCENGHIRRGIDLTLSSFEEGAVLISSNGSRSGIVFDLGSSGEVYAEKDGKLVVKGGDNGVRLDVGGGEFFQIGPGGKVEMSAAVRKSLKLALQDD